MTEIFINVSPHRSGTQSVTAFARAHGIAASHLGNDIVFDGRCKDITVRELWRISHGLIYEAATLFSDLPWPIIYHHAAQAYPKAKFFLVHRDIDDWIASIRRHMNGRNFSYLERLFYARFWSEKPAQLALSGYADDELIDGYHRHMAKCLQILGERLTHFDLKDLTLSDQLAKFLGVEKRGPIACLK